MPYRIDEGRLVGVALRHQWIFLLLMGILVSGCRKENAKPSWDVDLLVPVAKTTLTIEDIFSDTLYTVGPDNGIIIAFTEELFALDLDTVLEIPDTTYAYRYGLPIPGPISITGGTTVLSLVDESKLGLDPIELSTVIVRSGQIRVEGISMVNGPTVAELELPNASLMGSTIQTTIDLPPGTPANPATETVTIDIAGYTFDLTGTAMNNVNTLTNSIQMFTAVGAPAVDVTDQDSIIALLNYDGIVPEYARGYLGMENVHIDETTDLDFFGNIISGVLDLDQVSVKMKISNGVGVDAQAFINSLNSVNNRTSNSVGLVHSVMNGPVNITRGVDLGNGFISSYQEIELNNGNSNIDQFVENLPDALEYDIDLAINPLGNISNGNDFLYYDSEMRIDLDTEIPLCVIADALTLQDTSTVNIPGSSQSPGLQYGTLNLFVNNGFPLDAEFLLEIYSNGTSYASIPVSPGISSASIDGSGNVIAPTPTKLVVELNPELVDLLYEHEQVRFTVVFDTPALSGQHIKIKDTHFMDIQMTADFNYVVNSDG